MNETKTDYKTIQIKADLHRELKHLCIDLDIPIAQFVDEKLRKGIEEEKGEK